MSIKQSLLSRTPARIRLSWRAAERDERGSASIELGFGLTVVLLVGMLAIDLYTLSKADTGSARVAATMADYVSRERSINGDEIAALGRYLHEHELGARTKLVYIISAVHQPSGDDPATVLWVDDTIRLGEAGGTMELATKCKARGVKGWQKAVFGDGALTPPRLTLPGNTVVIVVEVCAKLLQAGMFTDTFISSDIYRLHALPTRDYRQRTPAAPVHTPPPVVENSPGTPGRPPHDPTALAAFAPAQVVAKAGVS